MPIRTLVLSCLLTAGFVGCDAISARSGTDGGGDADPAASGNGAAGAAGTGAAAAAAEGPLASAPLPDDLIALEVAEECVTDHRFDEWAQVRKVFRFEGEALEAWNARQEKWAPMKEEQGGVPARTWLLSGLRPEQQRYWARWVFYRNAVRLLSSSTSRKLQERCWKLAAPYADRQMERGYVAEDPYLKGDAFQEDKMEYFAEVEKLLE